MTIQKWLATACQTLITTAMIAALFMQPVNAQGGDENLSDKNDEFDNSTELEHWRQLNVMDWNEKWQTLEVEPSSGHLKIIPKSSAWFEDFVSGFLYKEITGDFIVTTRIKVTGNTEITPTKLFSLAGLMVRKPHEIDASHWKPNEENWLFFSTGSAIAPGQPQFEIKTTVRSLSTLKVFDAPQGWLELRIARISEVFYLLYKPDGGEWSLLDEFIRPDLPDQLQVGVTAYSDWNSVAKFYPDAEKYNKEGIDDGNPDVVATFDYVRFRKPKFQRQAIATLSPERFNELTAD